jgi:hypothetical protein
MRPRRTGRPSIAKSAITLAARAFRNGDLREAERLVNVYRGARNAGAAKPDMVRDPDDVADLITRRVERTKRAIPTELRALCG